MTTMSYKKASSVLFSGSSIFNSSSLFIRRRISERVIVSFVCQSLSNGSCIKHQISWFFIFENFINYNTDGTSGTETVSYSGAPEINPHFLFSFVLYGSCCSTFCFLCSFSYIFVVLLSFLLAIALTVCDLRLLITPFNIF